MRRGTWGAELKKAFRLSPRRFGRSTLRLSLRAGFREKREKWRTPQLFRSMSKKQTHVTGESQDRTRPAAIRESDS
jgi:hypothetical protein